MEGTEYLFNSFWIFLYSIILLGFLIGIVYWAINWKRKKTQKLHEFDLTFLQIRLAKDNETEIQAAEHLFASLSGLRKPFFKALLAGQYRISLEIVSKSDGIGFYVIVPDEIVTYVEKQINAVYPDAEIDIVDPNEIWDRGKFTRVAELKFKNPSYTPIKTHEEIKTDSLNLLTSSMSKLGPQEVLAIQMVISPAGDSWRTVGRKFVSGIRMKMANPDKQYNIDNSYIEGIEKKISYPGFDTAIRVVSISDDNQTAQLHVGNTVQAFEQFTDVNQNKFLVKWSMLGSLYTNKLINDFVYRKISVKDITIPILSINLFRNMPVLNTVELATVFHFPNKNIQTPNILWLTARRASAPTHLPDETEGIWVGESYFRGVKKQVHIKEKDRTRHFYIIGQTGTGKSELLKFMALQDIKNGEGVAIIDPHGTDVQDLLTKIPEERIDDVIYFNVSDLERPMGLNLLEHNTEDEKHMIINSFIALLYKLYDPNRQGMIGPILERAIRNVMLTAMIDKNSSMVDVLRLLIDDSYSKKFIDKIQDPLVKRYWTDEVANTPANKRGENMGYFVSKFDKFVTDKLMRNILGQPKSAFNLPDVMANKKILLVDLAKGKIGEENSNFLGLILVPKIL
ncbi:type IV secretory system conjugative DNA transfer family protein, partial [Patescibacteria group bacterium]